MKKQDLIDKTYAAADKQLQLLDSDSVPATQKSAIDALHTIAELLESLSRPTLH